ncbi:PREDICTED: uncharacterized protein LOC106786171 [Polistes canadensis]|uniref:uncharacterized protein LOC106786171 n=1 Tax=Polistes canadensis TaxID=91411 RepID=UPI00071903B4|nr:PREDICTED: uncharacterized protein LOC106786171 [Polistes canadensis]
MSPARHAKPETGAHASVMDDIDNHLNSTLSIDVLGQNEYIQDTGIRIKAHFQLSCLLCYLFLCKSSGQPTNNILLGYQDSLGQYSFGYSTLNSARSEVKTVDGAIHGVYSYIDDNGMIQSTEYVADNDGFRVVATNLPQAPLPVEDTAEVIAARKDHLNAFLIAEQMAVNSGYGNVNDNLEKINADKEEILTKDNQVIFFFNVK